MSAIKGCCSAVGAVVARIEAAYAPTLPLPHDVPQSDRSLLSAARHEATVGGWIARRSLTGHRKWPGAVRRSAVFISYASQDAVVANAIVENLEHAPALRAAFVTWHSSKETRNGRNVNVLKMIAADGGRHALVWMPGTSG